MAETLDLVEGFRKDVQTKLDELRPAHEEYIKLEGIIANFDGITSGNGASAPRARKRGTTATADRASRGQRPQQFLAVIKDNPGITVSEAATKMGTNNNYLYRLAKDLTESGEVRKEGKGYVVMESAAE